MFKKSPLKATKLHQRRRRARIIKTSFFVASILLMFGITVWVSRLPLFALTSVEVTGNAGIDSQDIETVVQKHLAGAYASVYAKSNKFLYPKDDIVAELRAAFPSIETLHVDTKGNTVDIVLSERKPSYVWCKGKPRLEGEQCYFMDASGYLFSQGPQVSGNAYLTFFGLLTDENPIGKTFLNTQEIEGITTIKSTLDKNNISVMAVNAEDNEVREIYLSEGGKILFRANQDISIIASSIELLKKKTKLLNYTSTSTLEYIDLRFGNKVYYKFVGDNAVQSSE
jgi:cell division septal protein FtsQ